MRKRLFYVVVFSLTLILASCSSEQQEQKEVLAKINDFQLSLEEFEYQLAAELEMEKDFKLTREAKKEFLEQLIRKELLIQEARRMKLDRRDDFVRTIERYWESTLIRDLMDLKGKELSKRTKATEEEVLALYEEMKASDADLPSLEDMRERIKARVEGQKKRERLREWIKKLREDADVEIDEKMLYGGE
jgi:SurA-like protein